MYMLFIESLHVHVHVITFQGKFSTPIGIREVPNEHFTDHSTWDISWWQAYFHQSLTYHMSPIPTHPSIRLPVGA